MLVGGLLTKGIKAAYKAYRKTGKKTAKIVKILRYPEPLLSLMLNQD